MFFDVWIPYVKLFKPIYVCRYYDNDVSSIICIVSGTFQRNTGGKRTFHVNCTLDVFKNLRVMVKQLVTMTTYRAQVLNE